MWFDTTNSYEMRFNENGHYTSMSNFLPSEDTSKNEAGL